MEVVKNNADELGMHHDVSMDEVWSDDLDPSGLVVVLILYGSRLSYSKYYLVGFQSSCFAIHGSRLNELFDHAVLHKRPLFDIPGLLWRGR